MVIKSLQNTKISLRSRSETSIKVFNVGTAAYSKEYQINVY